MKTNYNYKYIAVSHSDRIIWGLGTTAEEAFRDAMWWMHDANPDADEYTDWELFRESKSYAGLTLSRISLAALATTNQTPHGRLLDWLQYYNLIDFNDFIMTLDEYNAWADEYNRRNRLRRAQVRR